MAIQPQPQPDRFAAQKRETAEILRTTEKNLPARMVGLGIGPTCGRCAGSGNYSFNQTDGTRCYGCQGNRVIAPKKATEWQAAIQQAQAAVADGRLDGYLTYLDARKVAKRAGDTVMAAWTASGVSARYDWRKACERGPDGLPLYPEHRRLSDANKLMHDEYDRVAKMASALQAKGSSREEHQAGTVALAEATERAVQRIRSIADLHLGQDGGDPKATALARMLDAQHLALSVGAYSELFRRAPETGGIGQGRVAIREAVAAATEAATTGEGLDRALETLTGVMEKSPASLLVQATRQDWKLYTPYSPRQSELEERCADLRHAVEMARAAMMDGQEASPGAPGR
jgi:hypothetical protein